MQERHRDDGFEATFVVRTPRKQAWDRLIQATPADDGLSGPEPGQWWIPGIEGAADEIEVRPGELLRARKATWPCDGTEIVITLEDEEDGTRITIAQTGFGPDFEQRRPWLASGWHPILADLVLFFERGVALGRHLTAWSNIGCAVAETPAGLTVGDVQAGGFAAQAGMEPGDLIVRLAGSPVLTIRDLSVLVRGPLRTGTATKVRYLRGDQVLTGRGTT